MAQLPDAASCISEPVLLSRAHTSRHAYDGEAEAKAARVVELRKLLVDSEAARRALEATAAAAEARAAALRGGADERERECATLRQEVREDLECILTPETQTLPRCSSRTWQSTKCQAQPRFALHPSSCATCGVDANPIAYQGPPLQVSGLQEQLAQQAREADDRQQRADAAIAVLRESETALSKALEDAQGEAAAREQELAQSRECHARLQQAQAEEHAQALDELRQAQQGAVDILEARVRTATFGAILPAAVALV